MATNKHQIAEDIRRIAQFFQSAVGAADELERIGSLDNAAAEAVRAKDAAYVERDAAIDEMTNAKDDAKKAKKVALDIVEKARAQAATIVADAQATIDEVRIRSNVEMQKMSEQVSAEAEARRDVIVSSAARIQADVEVMNAQIIDKQKELIIITGEIAIAEARLNKAQVAINKILGS